MIGIVILNYNSAADTIQCVHEIQKNTNRPYDIYIVDNASKDDSLNELRNVFDENIAVTIMAAEQNGGYSTGNNVGLRKAFSDGCLYAAIVNPDIRIWQNALDFMAETLDEHANLAVVGGKILTPTGELGMLNMQPYTLKELLLSVSGKLSRIAKLFGIKLEKSEYDETKGNPQIFNGPVHGCCFVARMDVLQTIGYFDERFFLNFEENVLWYKYSKLGYLSAIQAKAVVTHMCSTTIMAKGNAFQTRCLYESAVRYLVYYQGLRGVKLRLTTCILKLLWKYAGYKTKSFDKDQYEVLKKKFKTIKKEARIIKSDELL